jgi:predicted phosphatase
MPLIAKLPYASLDKVWLLFSSVNISLGSDRRRIWILIEFQSKANKLKVYFAGFLHCRISKWATWVRLRAYSVSRKKRNLVSNKHSFCLLRIYSFDFIFSLIVLSVVQFRLGMLTKFTHHFFAETFPPIKNSRRIFLHDTEKKLRRLYQIWYTRKGATWPNHVIASYCVWFKSTGSDVVTS